MSQKMKQKKSKLITILFIILIALIITVSYMIILRITNELPTQGEIISGINTITPEQEEEKPKDTTISMCVVGDIMCHNTQYYDAYDSSTGTYDFSYVFSNISDELGYADLTIGNLETTFAGADRGYSSYPTFNTPDALAEDLAELGFDILSTANNHSLDKGYKGLVRTLEVLDKNGISHMGTYSSEEEQSEILVKDVNGIKIAFLAYTYGTNGIPVPSGKEYCVNLIDKDKIKEDLEKAKSLNVDLISVSMHWGAEYKLKPISEQEKLADFLFENGADIILGSHPHVIEPMETRTITLEDGTTKEGFLIYSLGNFVSGQVKQYTNHSIILNLEITKHAEGNITIDSIDYTPIYVFTKSTSPEGKFKILDINEEIEAFENGESNISQSLYNKLIDALEVTEEVMN